jgi:hypothetical protein
MGMLEDDVTEATRMRLRDQKIHAYPVVTHDR